MNETLLTIIYFLIAILILVTVHEFGHYLAAIWTKTRAEIFSVGMGKRLFGWNKLDGFTIGDLKGEKDYGDHTDWRISLMPIGGYVKISGMVDESMEGSENNLPPRPFEFRSKSALQKVFILSAGVIFNIILAFIIFIGVNYSKHDTLYLTNKIGYVDPYSNAYKVGFRSGDEILSINNYQPNSFQEAINLINRDNVGTDRNIILLSQDSEKSLFIPYDSILKYISDSQPIEFLPESTHVIFGKPVEDGNAFKAGLAEGDTVKSVNGTPIRSTSQFKLLVQSNKNKTIDISIIENGIERTVQTQVNSEGYIGIAIGSVFTGSKNYVNIPFGEAVKRGWDATINMFRLFFQSIKQIFDGTIEAKKAIGGPIMIAKQAKVMGDLGWGSYLVFLASLSISLAIINILPLPVLDGGHILIVLIEKIKGSELSENLKIRIQAAGMVLMFLLMAVIVFMDLTR